MEDGFPGCFHARLLAKPLTLNIHIAFVPKMIFVPPPALQAPTSHPFPMKSASGKGKYAGFSSYSNINGRLRDQSPVDPGAVTTCLERKIDVEGQDVNIPMNCPSVPR